MPVYPVTLLSDRDSLYSRETLLGIFGTPEETCLIMSMIIEVQRKLQQHVAHMSMRALQCKLQDWVILRIWMGRVTHVSHVSEPCEWAMWVSHVICTQELCHAYESAYIAACHMTHLHVCHMSHLHVCHMSEYIAACHSRKWVMLHVWMSHVTHMKMTHMKKRI